MKKQIIGLSGGFMQTPQNPLLDLYVLATSQAKNPKICFLPTASGDQEICFNFFDNIFEQHPCQPSSLRIVTPRLNQKEMEKEIVESDIIYVGGGNTKSMLALWKEWKVDVFLKKAYEKGVVLAGCSAGLVCWFEECLTDSLPGEYSALYCLGLLKGSVTPHYGSNNGRREAYYSLLEKGLLGAGYAVEDGVGLHFINGKFVRAISSDENATAYYLYQDAQGKVEEEAIKTQYLGEEENFHKYISSVIFPNILENEDTIVEEIRVVSAN